MENLSAIASRNGEFEENSFDEINYENLNQFWIKFVQMRSNNTYNANNVSKETLSFADLLKGINPENHPELMREKFIRDVLVIVFYSFIIIVSLFGNLMVCKVFLSKKCMRSQTTNIILVNLTISDLLVTIFTIPITTGN
jgi:hypothetical protein